LSIDILKQNLENINDLQVKYKENLCNYTTFRVGGPADIFLIPETKKALKELLFPISETNLATYVLGQGSNVIVADKGFRGIIIYTGKLQRIRINNKIIKAEAGIKLSKLAQEALKNNLSGLEFASGIPGTLGGALYMNAGAYENEIKDLIQDSLLYDYHGNEILLPLKKLNLSYRKSILQEKKLIAIEITIKLRNSKKSEIKKKMDILKEERLSKQPLNWPSAGSTFKRPEGHYAGKLIEKAGLKGTQIGDAQVSKKHAGFIVNRGGASANDIINLIKYIQKEVYKQSGVNLEVEPQIIGEF